MRTHNKVGKFIRSKMRGAGGFGKNPKLKKGFQQETKTKVHRQITQ